VTKTLTLYTVDGNVPTFTSVPATYAAAILGAFQQFNSDNPVSSYYVTPPNYPGVCVAFSKICRMDVS
jgi:hypothetical protein